MTNRVAPAAIQGVTRVSPVELHVSGNKFIGVTDQVNVGEGAPPRATLRIFDFSNGDLLYELTDLPTYLLQRSDAISIS